MFIMGDQLASKLRVALRLLEVANDTPATFRSRRHRLMMAARKEIKEAIRLLEKRDDDL